MASRQELIDSLSEDELREIAVELIHSLPTTKEEEWATVSRFIRHVFAKMKQDSLRHAVDTFLGEMPDVDLAALVQGVQRKRRRAGWRRN